MKENWSKLSDETFSEYPPSKSVTVPLVVPDSTTVTPVKGFPVASLTFPVINRSCASVIKPVRHKNSVNRNLLLHLFIEKKLVFGLIIELLLIVFSVDLKAVFTANCDSKLG
jgi:hypothetical protein